MKTIITTTMTMAIAMAIVLTIQTPNAFASHGSSAIACEADGREAGLDGPFSQGLYDVCKEIGAGDEYYDNFIEACMSVEGNSRDDCESATDAD